MVENGEIGFRAAMKEHMEAYDRCCLERIPRVALTVDAWRKVLAVLEAHPGCESLVAELRLELLGEGILEEE